MPQVRIMHMPEHLRFEIMFVTEKNIPTIRANLDRYLILPPMEAGLTSYPRGGQDLAEEMFDLTNNPSREEERMERYGNGKSLSSGDIVRTEDGDFLCLSIGWAKL